MERHEDERNRARRPATERALGLLEPLLKTAGGRLIHAQVTGLIERTEERERRSEAAWGRLLKAVILTAATDLPADSPLRVQLLLIERLLEPPVSPEELESLGATLAAGVSGPRPTLDGPALQQAFMPMVEGLLKAVDVPMARAPDAVAVPEPEPEAVASEPEPEVVASEPEPDPEPEPGIEAVAGAGDAPSEDDDETALSMATECVDVEADSNEEAQSPDERIAAEGDLRAEGAYRQFVDEQRRDFQGLQEAFAETVTTTTRRAADFASRVEQVMARLRLAEGTADADRLRGELVALVEELARNNRGFTDALGNTRDYLSALQSSSQQLSDELSRVRVLSLTDELTGLANRRAFLRRLEDEVGRARRYGFPLGLVVIDIDHFKDINDRYGHASGDEALRCYAKEILSIFRHHDLVARYGGEEFVVLLPNTEEEGALRSVQKVQRRAAEVTWACEGGRMPAPMFSAGIAIYRKGDTPSTLIERADNALYQAKRLGRNRIEVDSAHRPTTT